MTIVFISILLIVLALAAVIFLFVTNRRDRNAQQNRNTEPKVIDLSCCGAHEVCEFNAVKSDPSIIEYFDDEELDSLKGISADDYSDEDIDRLREVLYSLTPHDIRMWLLSLQRRDIALPLFLQQEARDLAMADDAK